MQVLCQEFMSTHFRIRYGNIGCQIFQGRVTKIMCIDFWPKTNIPTQRNLCTYIINRYSTEPAKSDFLDQFLCQKMI